MIRLMKLVDFSTKFLSEDETNAPDERPSFGVDDDPRDNMGANTLTGTDGSTVKAQLFSMQKQVSQLYNMIGEDEGVDDWVSDKLAQAAEFINSVFNHIQYEKTGPATIGSGDGAPADRLPPDVPSARV